MYKRFHLKVKGSDKEEISLLETIRNQRIFALSRHFVYWIRVTFFVDVISAQSAVFHQKSPRILAGTYYYDVTVNHQYCVNKCNASYLRESRIDK